MTDITELALIAKIKKQTENFDTVVLKEAEANALVEALEKAQAERDEFRRRFNLERSILEDADKDLETLRQRIADLESRTVTVKLPPKIERDNADGWLMYKGGRVGGGAAEWYNKALDDVGAELTAAGIKVEGE